MNRVRVRDNNSAKLNDTLEENDGFVYDKDKGDNKNNKKEEGGELSLDFLELIKLFKNFTLSEGKHNKSIASTDGQIHIRAFNYMPIKVEDLELGIKSSFKNYIWPARLVVVSDTNKREERGEQKPKQDSELKELTKNSKDITKHQGILSNHSDKIGKATDGGPTTTLSEVTTANKKITNQASIKFQMLISLVARTGNATKQDECKMDVDGHTLHSSLGIYNIKNDQQLHNANVSTLKSSLTDHIGKSDQQNTIFSQQSVSKVFSKILNHNIDGNSDQEVHQHLSMDEEMPLVHNSRKRGYYALANGEDHEVAAIMRKRLRSRSPFFLDQETIIREWKSAFKPIFVELK